MRILIAAVGKLKAGPEQALFAEYSKRIPWKVEVKELPQSNKTAEGAALLKATGACDVRIVLDERGETLSSRELAARVSGWQKAGDSTLGFIIGGPEGLSEEVRKSAALVLSFGRLSWPHMLARAMLAEQLYRTSTLLAGHPYHRD